jgi:hypothetical protein
MERPRVPIEQLGKYRFRVCTPGGGLCVETTGEQSAKAVAEAIYCSSHSSMRASRASVQ